MTSHKGPGIEPLKTLVCGGEFYMELEMLFQDIIPIFQIIS